MRKAAFVIAFLAVLGLVLPWVGGASVAGAGDVAPAAPASDDAAAAALESAGDGVETTMVVRLHNDTDASWTVTVRHRLEDDNETAAFRSFADDWVDGEAGTGVDADMFRTLANRSSEAAGREMAVENVSRSAAVRDGTGVLVLEFTWTNFLERVGDELRLRDAFALPDNETWLRSLEPGQRLVVRTPPGYSVRTTSAPVENNSLVFEGARTFETPPVARYQRISDPTTGTTTRNRSGTPWAPVAGGLVAAALIVAAALVVVFRDGSTDAGGGEPAAAAPDDGGPPDDPGKEATPADPVEDLSLLSDEERIERLIERNGGRMKQATIVRETGWSDAKVSQLLSAMADEDRVEKLRLGRENLISLPGEGEEPEGGDGRAGGEPAGSRR